MNRASKVLSAPIRGFFNPRFESLSNRLDSIEGAVRSLSTPDPAVVQAAYLARVDVSDHNRQDPPPAFTHLISQAASAAQCDDPTYLAWLRKFTGAPATAPLRNTYNRKTWEWAFIAEAITQAGLMKAGNSAVGFGVGTEPLPALFASHGLDVLATDQGADSGVAWASTGQLMTGLAGLSRPHLLSDEELAVRVRMQDVDMNDVPADIGTFDIVWSSCVIEHLGSPARGLEFVLESCRLLAPGGIAVHTTELELTRKEVTADYGNCAVYRLEDLQEFSTRLAEVGCTASFNFTVPMDSPEDRWISLILVDGEAAPPDLAHLKLAIFDSVSTSFGLLIHRLP